MAEPRMVAVERGKENGSDTEKPADRTGVECEMKRRQCQLLRFSPGQMENVEHLVWPTCFLLFVCFSRISGFQKF